jgi:hypothetical protein
MAVVAIIKTVGIPLRCVLILGNTLFVCWGDSSSVCHGIDYSNRVRSLWGAL